MISSQKVFLLSLMKETPKRSCMFQEKLYNRKLSLFLYFINFRPIHHFKLSVLHQNYKGENMHDQLFGLIETAEMFFEDTLKVKKKS